MKRAVILVASVLLGVSLIVSVVVARGGTRSANASEIATRVKAAQSELAASIAPDTTFHKTLVTHDAANVPTDAFYLPQDFQSDTWISFDASGKSTVYAKTVGIDGTLYQQSVQSGNNVILTDVATGQTQTIFNAAITTSQLQQSLDTVSGQNATLLQADAPVQRSTIDGAADFVLTYQAADGVMVEYVNPTSYQVTRLERHQGDVNGPVVETDDFTHLEVLPGNAAPTPVAISSVRDPTPTRTIADPTATSTSAEPTP